MGDWRYIINNAPEKYKADAEKNYARLDSVVWDDEELAYKNAKSLNTMEAYESFMFLYGKGKYGIEISSLWLQLKQLNKLLGGTKK